MPEEFKSNFDLPTIAARHFVSFYQQPHYPVTTVCDYLAEGLSQGESAVAVVVLDHAELITKGLNGTRLTDRPNDRGRTVCLCGCRRTLWPIC